MPQDGRYRRRSRSRSKRNRRRRHGSSKSSGSSYSRSRSRSPEKRYREKERSSRRTPPKYRRSSKRSPSHERKRRYDRRSRSASSSPRRHSRDKKEYNLESSKVLTGNFSDIPGLDYIGRGGKGRGKNESSQDLDLRLRELETQQGSAGSSRSRVAEQSKSSQRGYYDSKSGSQESYKQRSRSNSPEEKKYNSSRYSKERSMSPNDDRYRDQKDKKRPDYGLRVEVKRKPSPKRSKFDPSLVVVPRRKDEGLQALFDRPEIVVRNLDDDPEMYPEKYERFACWRKSPEHNDRKNDREYSREREDRPRKQSRHHKEVMRSPSLEPQQPREATVMMKPFTVYEKYEQSLRNKPAAQPQELDNYLQRSQDFSLSQSSLPLSGSNSMFSSGLGLDSVLDLGSDLRLDLDVRRQFLVREAEKQLDLQQLQTTPTTGRLSGSAFSLDRREISSADRRPVRERLGELDAVGRKMDSGVPDFRKEVEELQKLDPTAQPFRGNFFQHDVREERSLSEEKRDTRPPLRGRGGRGTFVPRGSYRGGRGFPRGTYRGSRGFNRGFRGGYNRGLSTWTSSRGGYASSWKHDKFEGKDRESREKREKKEKKSKSSDKKKTKKSSKRTPERSKSKRESKK